MEHKGKDQGKVKINDAINCKVEEPMVVRNQEAKELASEDAYKSF